MIDPACSRGTTNPSNGRGVYHLCRNRLGMLLFVEPPLSSFYLGSNFLISLLRNVSHFYILRLETRRREIVILAVELALGFAVVGLPLHDSSWAFLRIKHSLLSMSSIVLISSRPTLKSKTGRRFCESLSLGEAALCCREANPIAWPYRDIQFWSCVSANCVWYSLKSLLKPRAS